MPIRPGNVTLVINGSSVLVDDIRQNFITQEFDRQEFDHQKLASSRLANSAVAQIVQMLGGKSAEVVISEAVGPGYIPRPLTPNSYPTVWQQVKQSINIAQYKISCKDPANFNPTSVVLGLDSINTQHTKRLRSFQTRLAAISGDMTYEQLQAFQLDNIQTTYFTTGISVTGPEIALSNVLISEFDYGLDFAVPDGSGGFEIYRGFDMTLEVRTVETAFAT